MFSSGYRGNKLKTSLRLAVNRLKLLEKKKTEIAQKARKEIADYIQAGKDDRARIRVEHIIREDYLVEAMELIEMYCDLLLARFGLIESSKVVDPGLEEAIASIIWITPRMSADCQELRTVAEQFTGKYGKEFKQMCLTDSNSTVNSRLISKMDPKPPPKILVERYLIEIARNYNVPFEPDAMVMTEENLENLIDIGELSSSSSDFKPPGGPGGGSGGGNAFADPSQNPAYPPPPGSQSYPAPPGSQNYPPPQGNPAYPPQGNQAYPPPNQSMPGPPPASVSGPSAPSPPNPYPGQDPPRYSAINNDSTYPPPQNQMPMPPGPPSGPPGAVGGYPPSGPLPPKNGPIDASFPELPSVPTNLPNINGSANSGDQDDLDFDDLSKRFEELKKKK